MQRAEEEAEVLGREAVVPPEIEADEADVDMTVSQLPPGFSSFVPDAKAVMMARRSVPARVWRHMDGSINNTLFKHFTLSIQLLLSKFPGISESNLQSKVTFMTPSELRHVLFVLEADQVITVRSVRVKSVSLFSGIFASSCPGAMVKHYFPVVSEGTRGHFRHDLHT